MLLVVVLARGLGQRTGIPFTILLTLIGIAYAFVPGPQADAGAGRSAAARAPTAALQHRPTKWP
ncbi:hypothetical protein EFY87_05325 [Flexivirga caeni]|uniref:Uncharacterized protein n=1 Tax=Flexivirga caeni TaxID=2294115 RepID=A0A3M9MFR1_9MICO|nr:hypothetical protein EFY87_05325 [Flexivirga caeni]